MVSGGKSVSTSQHPNGLDFVSYKLAEKFVVSSHDLSLNCWRHRTIGLYGLFTILYVFHTLLNFSVTFYTPIVIQIKD